LFRPSAAPTGAFAAARAVAGAGARRSRSAQWTGSTSTALNQALLTGLFAGFSSLLNRVCPAPKVCGLRPVTTHSSPTAAPFGIVTATTGSTASLAARTYKSSTADRRRDGDTDAAYFIGSALSVEDRRGHEKALPRLPGR
jgi:hypothetical protein